MPTKANTSRGIVRVGVLFCVGLWAAPLWAWPGFSWEQWRAVTTWQRPDVTTEQAGRRELVPLLCAGDDPNKRIDEIRAWETKRAVFAKVIERFLGSPGQLEVPKPQAETIERTELADHVRLHVRIRGEADEWIPAYVLLPKPLPELPTPTMICLHQTVAQGKDEPCGIEGDPELALALELVRRGYVCIAPDVIGFGERTPPGAQPYHDALAFYKKHPNWSFFGKMSWDITRVIDYLETLPFVDSRQIGCIGHSHGAYGSLMAAAFEPRISLVIASGGFTTFRADPAPDRWSHATALWPQLGLYLSDVTQIPFDWQHIVSLIAPRPLFVWYGTQDKIFPNTIGLDALFKDVQQVYGLYGAADDLTWQAYDGDHCFPAAGRTAAYQWLDQRFIFAGDVNRAPKTKSEWERQRAVIRRLIRCTIGEAPATSVALDVATIEHKAVGEYEQSLIEYTVAPGERVRAYLCVPTNGKPLYAGMLVLHQTTPEGKRESVGLAGEPSLAFGVELAARGYVTLSPDSITAGERIDRYGAFDTRGHYLRYPALSAMGKMLADAQRAVDVLVGVEGVDPRRIGVIGHSLGAEEALLVGAFDERIAAVVSSCAYATFAAEPEPTRWARDRWFSYMPKLRPVFLRGKLPLWDWPDVVRLIAPRGAYQYNTRDDQIFTESESAYEAGETIRAIWELYGAPADQFVNVIGPGQHAVSDDAKAKMYAWLDRQLRETK